jgi:hypothetical protein
MADMTDIFSEREYALRLRTGRKIDPILTGKLTPSMATDAKLWYKITMMVFGPSIGTRTFPLSEHVIRIADTRQIAPICRIRIRVFGVMMVAT